MGSPSVVNSGGPIILFNMDQKMLTGFKSQKKKSKNGCQVGSNLDFIGVSFGDYTNRAIDS